MLVSRNVSGGIFGVTSRTVASSTSSRSSWASIRPRRSVPRTAAEITPCNRLEPARFWVTLRPPACARAASMRQVVVLPLLPVTITLWASLVATVLCRTPGSTQRATAPGKLVPPPTRRTLDAVPAALPAASASVKRACADGETGALPSQDLAGGRSATRRIWRPLLHLFGVASGTSSHPRPAAACLPGRGGARHRGRHPRWLARALRRGRSGGRTTAGRNGRRCPCLPGTPALRP